MYKPSIIFFMSSLISGHNVEIQWFNGRLAQWAEQWNELETNTYKLEATCWVEKGKTSATRQNHIWTVSIHNMDYFVSRNAWEALNLSAWHTVFSPLSKATNTLSKYSWLIQVFNIVVDNVGLWSQKGWEPMLAFMFFF